MRFASIIGLQSRAALPPDASPTLADDILAAIDDPFFAIDARCAIIYANRRALQNWGLAAEAVIGQDLWQRFPQLHGTDFGQRLRLAIEARRPVEFEMLSPVSEHWVWMRVSPMRDGMTAVHWRNTTDRRRSEEALAASLDHLRRARDALRESELRFRQFFEHSPLGMAIAGPDYALREVNAALAQMLGYGAEDLVGRPFLDLVHPDDRTNCIEHARAVVEGRADRVQIEERFRHGSGAWMWVSVNVAPIRDAEGRTIYSVAVLEDIDERRRMTERLHELNERLEQQAETRARQLAASDARMQAFFDNSLDWLSLFRRGADGAFRYVNLNRACAAAYGMARDEVIGRTVESVLGPEQAIVPLRNMRECLRTGLPQRYHARRTFAGITRLVDVVFVPVVEAAGEEPLIISTARDLTEREELEAQLRQAQKMEAVGQLTGGVAHDFNNLLTAVISSLELIHRRAAEPRVQKLAETALTAAMRGGQLTSQLLSFSRRQTLRPVAADIGTMLGETEMLLQRAVGETIALERQVAADLWLAELDQAQFQAAMMNLVVNARDAMPDGGRIVIAAENATITEADAQPDLGAGDYVALRVSDTGHGIPPEVLGRVFEPFFTTKEVGKGSGLGLSMVHGFVTQSGGAVRISSTPGRGTTVRLFLPCLRSGRSRGAEGEPADASPAPAAASNAAGPAASILFVEDNEDVSGALAAVLRAQGHAVTLARSGIEALGLVRSGVRFDLLLSDVVMPGGISGMDLAREACRVCPSLKVLLTSGYAADAAGHSAAEGEFPFIAKPFHPVDLVRRIRTLFVE